MSKPCWWILFLCLHSSFLFAQANHDVTIKDFSGSERLSVGLAGKYRSEALTERLNGHYIHSFSYYLFAMKSLPFSKSGSVDYFEYSYSVHREALSMADTLLDVYKNLGSRIVLSRYLYPVYEQAIQLASKLYGSSNSLKYLDDTFELVEKSRNLMVVEAVHATNLRSFGGVPPGLIQKEQQLSSRIVVYRNLSDFERDRKIPRAELLKVYADSLEIIEQQTDSLNDYLKTHDPSYYELMHRDHYVSAGEITNSLKGSTHAVFEYFCGDSAIYIFVFTPSGRFLESVPVDTSFYSLVMTFQKAIIRSDRKTFTRTALQLYQSIFFPAEKHLVNCTHLRIIPDGLLGNFPFECLLKTPAGNEQDYNEFDYLLRHYCFSYSSSATLLEENRQRRNSMVNPRILALAPGFTEEMKNDYRSACKMKPDSFYLQLPEQRWSLKLMENMKKVFDGLWLTGNDANATSFIREAAKYDIIHIASHSIFDEQDPARARFVFAKEGCDTSASNGYIYTSDLYGMHFKAVLTVLGSCRTGFGKYRKGEGIVSISHAFSYAGCPALVYSLWEVDEKGTSSLLADFYDGIRNGLPKDEALTRAKLKALNQPDKMYANPYYWAGFVFSGDEVPLNFPAKKNKKWKLLIMGILGAVALLVFIARQRKGMIPVKPFGKN